MSKYCCRPLSPQETRAILQVRRLAGRLPVELLEEWVRRELGQGGSPAVDQEDWQTLREMEVYFDLLESEAAND